MTPYRGPVLSCHLVWQASQAKTALVGTEKAVAGDPYPPLPDRFAGATFDGSRSWDVAAMQKALEDFGFLYLPEFIPESITNLAFDQATQYFLGVLRSFEHGLSINKGMEGFDELAGLPSCAWERKPRREVAKTFEAGPLGMTVEPSTSEVKELVPGGQAVSLGVQAGWVVKKVIVGSQPLAAFSKLLSEGELTKDTQITFRTPTHYSPLAVSQKWGVCTSRGYQPKLGLGKCTDSEHFAECPAVMNCQLWMRNLLATLHNCLPTQLCWQPDGVSFKAGRIPPLSQPCSV